VTLFPDLSVSLNACENFEIQCVYFYFILSWYISIFVMRPHVSRWRINGAICEASFAFTAVHDCGNACRMRRQNAKTERRMREKSSVSDEPFVRRSFVGETVSEQRVGDLRLRHIRPLPH